MTIALITPNQALKNVLETIFQESDIDYLTFNSIKDIEEDNKFSLYVIDDADKQIRIESNSGNIRKIFDYPLRLGSFSDDIRHFLKQKMILEALKPIKMGEFCLNPQNNSLLNLETKKEVNLTEKEQSILLYLHSQGQNKTQRAELLGHVWHYAENVETHTLETHIYRLRQKIEVDPTIPEFLMTDEEGYYLNL
jgi:hypothetical protein